MYMVSAAQEDRTPLHLAAQKGHKALAETLVDRMGSNIAARTTDGSTMLHIAVGRGA